MEAQTQRQFTNPFTGETRTIPEGVVIRSGKEEDQEAINELCNDVAFFEQWDFMTGLWRKFVRNTNIIMVVAEYNGKLVSIAGMIIANKGKHWISFGSRSSPSIRGKNIFWACSVHKLCLALQRYGKPEKYMTVAASQEAALKSREGGKLKFQAVIFKHYMFAGYRMSAADLQTISDHVTSMQTNSSCKDVINIVQTADEFAQFLSPDSDASFILFPEGYFKIKFACYQVLPQIAYDVWDPEVRTFAVGRDSKGNVKSFSIGTTHSVQSGTSYQLEVFGEGDADTVLMHLRAHLPQIRSSHARFGGEVTLILEPPGHYSTEPLEQLFWEKWNFRKCDAKIETSISLVYDQPEIYQ